MISKLDKRLLRLNTKLEEANKNLADPDYIQDDAQINLTRLNKKSIRAI